MVRTSIIGLQTSGWELRRENDAFTATSKSSKSYVEPDVETNVLKLSTVRIKEVQPK